MKRKATGFFNKENFKIIQQAIKDVTDIMTHASILLRAFYIDQFEKNKELIIDSQIVSFACNIVQGIKKAPLRTSKKVKEGEECKNRDNNREEIEKKENIIKIFNDMLGVFNYLYNGKNHLVESKLSISHILAYSIENLITAYENNIVSHFQKYPRKFIKCDLLSKNFSLEDAKKLSFAITNYFMYDNENILDYRINISDYESLFVDKQTVKDKPRCWDLKVNPWLYLPKMLKINRALEKDFPNIEEEYRKLYNPLPFHSSFVPMHIRLDTSGISQLLMNKERIQEFKTLYELEHPGTILNMKDKGDMLSSFKKLTNKEVIDNEEAGLFATDMWKFLTNIQSCRQYKDIYRIDKNKVEWVFDNAILTDGISLSIQVIDKRIFGRKTLSGRKTRKENIVEKIPEYVIDDYKVISCDPGKKDILAFSEGIDTLTYTKGQRNNDILLHTRQNKLIKRKRLSNIEEFESQVLNKYLKRSCHSEDFKNYVVTRISKEEEMKTFYSQPIHRQFKYLGHTRTKSSESKFVDKTFKKFKNSNTKIKTCLTDKIIDNATKSVKTTKDILICWGDWGKNPNKLKGYNPTPGIGIRKRFESWFKTKTINEYLTSQTCPCCREKRCLKNHNSIHHLLRCTNDNCKSRWWNRNVVGSFNILHKALHPNLYEEEKRKIKRPKT